MGRTNTVVQNGHSAHIIVEQDHDENCRPERDYWRWHFRGVDVYRSYRGDNRGDGYQFLRFHCNSSNDCPASVLVRVMDIERTIEILLAGMGRR